MIGNLTNSRSYKLQVERFRRISFTNPNEVYQDKSQNKGDGDFHATFKK